MELKSDVKLKQLPQNYSKQEIKLAKCKHVSAKMSAGTETSDFFTSDYNSNVIWYLHNSSLKIDLFTRK